MPQSTKEQPQTAWQSLDPEVGVETRGRKAHCKARRNSITHRYPKSPVGKRLCCHDLKSPQADADAANETRDTEGITRCFREDTKQSDSESLAISVEVQQLESTRVGQDAGSDSDSDGSVNQTGAPFPRFAMYNLSAAAVVEGSVLPNQEDFTPLGHEDGLFGPRVGLRSRLDEKGNAVEDTKTEAKGCRFAAAVINFVLTTKASLKSSPLGFSLNAFLCAMADFVPQLGAFADSMDDVSGPRKLGTKMTWSLLMLMMEEAVTVEFGVVGLSGWSEAGIVALEKLDEFTTNILVQLVYSPPDTVTEDALYARYRDMKWLQDDLETLRRQAALVDYFRGELEEGYYLEDTIREMQSQLDRIAAQKTQIEA